MSRAAPYGSWKSPITSDLIVGSTVGLGDIRLDGADVYWVEARPSEGGRHVVVRHTPDGASVDVTPAPFSARTRAHEYGGGALAVADGTVFFSNFTDQRLYGQAMGAAPRPLTLADNVRYADLVVDRWRRRLVCVQEDHRVASSEPVNALVAMRVDGAGEATVIASGQDFYASPSLSPDGRRIAWLSWTHPNMPWDGTELWAAAVAGDGSVADAVRVAGGDAESVFQPAWSPDGDLYFVSDRNGWWNLYRWRRGRVEPVIEMAAEFGRPQWVFGMSTYGFASAREVLCTYCVGGRWHLGRVDVEARQLRAVETPHAEMAQLRVGDGTAVMCAGSPGLPLSVVSVDVTTERHTVMRSSIAAEVDAGYLSTPEAIAFSTGGGGTAHALFYPPRNPQFAGPPGERPPLLVKSHGGPTSAASRALDLRIQYWTSRGIAVLDVDYRGSSGYGRAYRQQLDGRWGIADVEDCINGARALVARDQADGNRLAISGGSAGGYTTLCALTFHDTFTAGASYYGVSDLEALAADTHKFESRYLERLVGPYPARRDLYRARSPIHHAGRLSCPVVFFQGLDDAVVPPPQTESMVAALRVKGLPVAYVPFPGEQHGFRRAENIKRALDAELSFYAQVFGFPLGEPVEPLPIENL